MCSPESLSPSRLRDRSSDGIAQRGARDGIPLTADPTYRRSHLRSSDGISTTRRGRQTRAGCVPRGRQRDGRTARVQHAAGSRWHARMQHRQQTRGNGRSATCNATRNTPCNMCTTQHTACVPCSRQTTCNMERGLDERYLPRELRRSPKRLERRVKLQFARPDREGLSAAESMKGIPPNGMPPAAAALAAALPHTARMIVAQEAMSP